MPEMDSTDKDVINRIQSDFPISARPYKELGAELGLSEEDVIERIQRLKDQGYIRRIGGNFGPEKIGFLSTLCAARVPEEKIELFTEAVNSYPGVTHNYLRENEFNIWFTIISPSREDIEKTLNEIKEKTGVTKIHNLPATRVFKIKAQFNL